MNAKGSSRRWLLVAALAAAASCGGSNDTTTTDTTATETAATDTTGVSDGVTATVEEPDPTGPPAPTAASTPDPETPDPETPDPETPDPETPAVELSDLDGLAVITVITPSSGNGEHPLLRGIRSTAPSATRSRSRRPAARPTTRGPVRPRR